MNLVELTTKLGLSPVHKFFVLDAQATCTLTFDTASHD